MKSITKNHYILVTLFLTLTLVILACEGPKIFETPTAFSEDDNIIGPVGTELITVYITCGNPPFDQQLRICQNGYTQLEGFQGAKFRTLSLEPNQVDDLIHSMLKNLMFRDILQNKILQGVT